jgi:hypothetical protein
MKMAVFWVAAPCSNVYQHFRGACCFHHQGDSTVMMETASTCETSVNFYQTTWRNNPKGSHLQKETSMNYDTRPFLSLHCDGFTLLNAEMNNKQLAKCTDWGFHLKRGKTSHMLRSL